MVEFYKDKGYAKVYHLGNHKCSLKLDHHRHDVFIRKQIQKHPMLTPKKLQIHLIKQKIDEGHVDGIKAISKKLADKRIIEQLCSEIVRPDENADFHSFTAVGIFKEACDVIDELYIF